MKKLVWILGFFVLVVGAMIYGDKLGEENRAKKAEAASNISEEKVK